MQKRTRGRPPSPVTDLRSNTLTIRLTEAEKLAFMSTCEKNLQNPSAVLRHALLNYIAK